MTGADGFPHLCVIKFLKTFKTSFNMKNILFCTLSLLFVSVFTTNAFAQNKANDEAGVLKMWDEVWNAYEANSPSMWSFYADDACEIYPDGSIVCGLQNIKAGYEAFAGMLEGTPSWSYTKPEVRFIEPTVALLIGEITSDIKLKGGQQVGGKMKFTALVRKTNGRWLIVYDCQTPMVQMPTESK